MIDDDIIITVVGINKGQVRIGIDAPKDVHIMREELYDRGVRKVNQRDSDVEGNL